jgi:hypothetical protein
LQLAAGFLCEQIVESEIRFPILSSLFFRLLAPLLLALGSFPLHRARLDSKCIVLARRKKERVLFSQWQLSRCGTAKR